MSLGRFHYEIMMKFGVDVNCIVSWVAFAAAVIFSIIGSDCSSLARLRNRCD